jgi:hypothetical protein
VQGDTPGTPVCSRTQTCLNALKVAIKLLRCFMFRQFDFDCAKKVWIINIRVLRGCLTVCLAAPPRGQYLVPRSPSECRGSIRDIVSYGWTPSSDHALVSQWRCSSIPTGDQPRCQQVDTGRCLYDFLSPCIVMLTLERFVI